MIADYFSSSQYNCLKNIWIKLAAFKKYKFEQKKIQKKTDVQWNLIIRSIYALALNVLRKEILTYDVQQIELLFALK